MKKTKNYLGEINAITNSISNENLKKIIKRFLEEHPERIRVWKNFTLLFEGDATKAFEHMKFLGSGKIDREERYVQCDVCGAHLKNYFLAESHEEKEPFFFGGTCKKNLEEDFEKIGLDYAVPKEKHLDKILLERDSKEKSFEYSGEVLESYKQALLNDIKNLEIQKKAALERLEEISRKKGREEQQK